VVLRFAVAGYTPVGSGFMGGFHVKGHFHLIFLIFIKDQEKDNSDSEDFD
jgi:hypothetical protein